MGCVLLSFLLLCGGAASPLPPLCWCCCLPPSLLPLLSSFQKTKVFSLLEQGNSIQRSSFATSHVLHHPKRRRREQHHPQGRAPPRKRRRGRQHHPRGGCRSPPCGWCCCSPPNFVWCCFSPLLFWVVPLSLFLGGAPFLPFFGGVAVPSRFGWCCFPSSLGAAGLPPPPLGWLCFLFQERPHQATQTILFNPLTKSIHTTHLAPPIRRRGKPHHQKGCLESRTAQEDRGTAHHPHRERKRAAPAQRRSRKAAQPQKEEEQEGSTTPKNERENDNHTQKKWHPHDKRRRRQHARGESPKDYSVRLVLLRGPNEFSATGETHTRKLSRCVLVRSTECSGESEQSLDPACMARWRSTEQVCGVALRLVTPWGWEACAFQHSDLPQRSIHKKFNTPETTQRSCLNAAPYPVQTLKSTQHKHTL